MGFEKVVEAKLWGIVAQNSTLTSRITMGDTASNAFTRRDNRLRGTLLWDRCMYVFQDVVVAGGATGGSYTVTIETDAVKGYTGLPISSTSIGPNSPTTIVVDSLHQSPSSPLPTHMNITQTASGGALTFNCHVIAKQYRGTLGTPGSTAERVLQGTMLLGTSAGAIDSGADDRGILVDATYAMGTSASNLGMNKMRQWDSAMYWAVAGVSISGTHDVDIVSDIGGDTVSVASTGTAGALNVAGEKLALANAFFGQSPNPSAIIWTETTAGGVSDARVVMIAKSGRGSLAKR